MQKLKDKKMVIIIVIFVFVIGVITVIYEKSNNKDVVENLEFSQIDEGDIKDEEIENEKREIYVHIIGEVKNEGIVKLEEGQRIADAIEMAGGVTEFADISRVNLAFVLSDGQKVHIPNINENTDDYAYVSDDSGNNIIVDNGNNVSKGGDMVNINTATQTELETLTGIGPSTAAKIIQYREKNGKFNKIEDLKNVSGIGDTKFEGIKDQIVVK